MKNKIRLLLAQKTVVVMLLASLLVVGTVSAAVIKGVALIRQAQEIANTPTDSSNTSAAASSGSTTTTPSSQDSNKTSSTPNTNSGAKAGTPQTQSQTKTQTSSGSAQTSGGTTTTPSTPAAPVSGGFQANCINVPSACGYPDASNTGVPAGVALTNSGSITITQDGAVVQNLLVNGQIIIHANNVTIKNTRIISSDYYPITYDRTGLLVQDSEIIGTSGNVTAGMSFDNYTARRVEITGTADGFKANANVLIEDSYIHDLWVANGSHNDGVQTTGGSGVTIRHNTFKLGNQDGINAILQLGTEGGSNSNWTIANNLLDGGGWMFNNGNQIPGSSVTNNRFTRRYAYGIGWIADSAVWTGNVYDDNGAAAPQT